MEPEIIEQQPDTNQAYIDAINQLKSTTVSKDQYDKILQERDNLVATLVNDQRVSTEAPEVEVLPTADECRAKLFDGKDKTNLQYVTEALALRDAVLRETGDDIFVGKGHQLTPTAEAYDSAEKTAQVFREAIEYSNGNPQLFTQELMRRTRDVGLPNKINIKR